MQSYNPILAINHFQTLKIVHICQLKHNPTGYQKVKTFEYPPHM